MLDPTAQEFRTAALELREANRTMYLLARRQIRGITAPAIEAVRKSAMDTLPKQGGLNQWVADAVIKAQILTGPKTAGVSIRARKTGHDLATINRGAVRHPVYGTWRAGVPSQPVQRGFFNKPLDALAPAVEGLFLAAMTETSIVAGFH